MEKFFHLDVIDIIPAHDIENMNMDDVDAVISTISLEGKGIEYIQVDPLLTDEDCIRVGEKLSKIHPKVSEKETISEEKLIMVDKAEQLLLDMGFHQVRVRIHGTIARIEILPEEFPKLVEETNRNLITKSFKEYGFTYVTMDLTGYRTGSMNETLNSDL